MGKSLKVSGKPQTTQVSVALNKAAKSPFINDEVLKIVSQTVVSIDKVLQGEKDTVFNLGALLAKLQAEITSYWKKMPGNITDYQIKLAFHNFVQVRFKLGESRVNEYIKLSERTDLHKLKFPISVLIEFSRLDSDALKDFFKESSISMLEVLPFKEIKKLVRDKNKNQRDKSSKKTGNQDAGEIVESLKISFNKVKSQFDDETLLDEDLEEVLEDIHEWYLAHRLVVLTAA